MGFGCVALYAAVNRLNSSFLSACRSRASLGSCISSTALSLPLVLRMCCVSSVLAHVPMRPSRPCPASLPGSGRRALEGSVSALSRRRLRLGSNSRMSRGGWKSKGLGCLGLRTAPIMTPLSLKVVSYSARVLPVFLLPMPTKIWLSRGCQAMAVTLPGIPTLRTTCMRALSRKTRAPASSWLPADTPVSTSCSSGLKMHWVLAYAHGRPPNTCTGCVNLRRSQILRVESIPLDSSVLPSLEKASPVMSEPGSWPFLISWLGRLT
mmetsp:Transcript_26509/g.57844  ORF Transcript_26509/g.57844 Transcript_26509/m.57844 type:complete len:265 (-) Transcript_26509:715-1509(-)